MLLDSQHLHSFEMSVLRLAAWLVLLALIFLPLEHLLALRPKRVFARGLGRDLGYYFVNGLVPSLLLAVPLALVAVAAHALVPYRFQALVAAWPLWLRVVVGFVIGEIGFYWGHRWAHQVPFLWRFHAIHHSAEEIYFLVSARAHPIDNAFIRLCGLIPAYVFGVASPLTPTGSLIPVMIVLVATAWGFFIHSNLRLRLGPLEWLVATPGFHHWHHTLDQPRDTNFASMLPCVDKLFGTLYLPRDRWPAAYGIDEKLPASIWGQLAWPFRSRPAGTVPEPAAADAALLESSVTDR